MDNQSSCILLIRIYIFQKDWSTETFRKQPAVRPILFGTAKIVDGSGDPCSPDIYNVVQKCQLFLIHTSFLIAIAMADLPIPTLSVASAYEPILPISSLSVKLHSPLRPLS